MTQNNEVYECRLASSPMILFVYYLLNKEMLILNVIMIAHQSTVSHDNKFVSLNKHDLTTLHGG